MGKDDLSWLNRGKTTPKTEGTVAPKDPVKKKIINAPQPPPSPPSSVPVQINLQETPPNNEKVAVDSEAEKPSPRLELQSKRHEDLAKRLTDEKLGLEATLFEIADPNQSQPQP